MSSNENTSPTITRRAALTAGTGIALAAPALITTLGASNAIAAGHASAEMMGDLNAKARRIKVGNFEVTTLRAGALMRDGLKDIFGLNVTEDQFAAAADANYISTAQAQFTFTPTVVNTGAQLILFDAGLNADWMAAALAEGGYTPEQITHVVLTHMHGDHINGLNKQDGTAAYPNAAYITGQVEFDAWSPRGNEGFDNIVKPKAENMTFLAPGDDVVTGITAMNAFGHTPGHMTYMIESEGQAVLIAADFANHYVWSIQNPEWEVRFDMDKEAATATRKRLLDMLATDKLAFIGYHMPSPAIGYIQKIGGGYRYVPVSYQFAG